MSEPCGSCGRDDDDVAEVRRVYLVAGTDEGAAMPVLTDDLELWCASCRATYPHQVGPG